MSLIGSYAEAEPKSRTCKNSQIILEHTHMLDRRTFKQYIREGTFFIGGGGPELQRGGSFVNIL